jgi:hypothetical protein
MIEPTFDKNRSSSSPMTTDTLLGSSTREMGTRNAMSKADDEISLSSGGEDEVDIVMVGDHHPSSQPLIEPDDLKSLGFLNADDTNFNDSSSTGDSSESSQTAASKEPEEDNAKLMANSDSVMTLSWRLMTMLTLTALAAVLVASCYILLSTSENDEFENSVCVFILTCKLIICFVSGGGSLSRLNL